MLDFSQEYYFTGFEILFSQTYYNCKPKTYKVQTFDNKKRITNEFTFINEKKDKLKKIIELNKQARYLKFNFNENFGGEYFVIRKIYFFIEFLEYIE